MIDPLSFLHLPLSFNGEQVNDARGWRVAVVNPRNSIMDDEGCGEGVDESLGALFCAAPDLLSAAEALMEEPDDDVARVRMLAAIAKARGGSFAEVAPVVAAYDENCWNCEHNSAQNSCHISEFGSGFLMEQTDEWITQHVLDDFGWMPPRHTPRACPGFKRAVKL